MGVGMGMGVDMGVGMRGCVVDKAWWGVLGKGTVQVPAGGGVKLSCQVVASQFLNAELY